MKLYEILGLTNNTSFEEIKKAYRKLSLKYHPDKSKEENCEQKFIEISQAYNVLKDPDKRARYDKLGDKYEDEDSEEDPYSLFKEMYEMGDVIPNLDVFVDISTDDLYSGCIIEQEYTRYNICNKCRGTGTFDCKKHNCNHCKGTGSTLVETHDGEDEFVSVECDVCNGNGIDVNVKLCDKCKGTIGNEESVSMEIDIPAGAYNGYIITEDNVGHEIPRAERKKGGHRRSGVNFIINEKPHKYFHRGVLLPTLKRSSKADLLYDINLTLAESLCGFKRKINHISGDKLKIEYKGQLWHNDYLVYEKKGMPIPNSDLYGDLFIRINIEKPNIDKSTTKALYKILPNKPNYDIKYLSTTKYLHNFDDYEKKTSNN